MGARILALQLLTLTVCTAYASVVPKYSMDNYVDSATQHDSKVMKMMEYKLDQVKQDYQLLKDELSRTTNIVEELKKEIAALKMTVMNRDEQQGTTDSDDTSSEEEDEESSVREVVEEYVENTDWAALRQGLDRLLDKDSVEYQQLQDINDHSWGHLWQVGSGGYEELAALLLDAGLPANKTDNVGDTILHGAAEGGRLPVAQLLVSRGADVDVRGWRRLTPFHKAALRGQPEMAKWLADRGADVRAADDHGMTALHFAAEHGHLPVVRLLVDLGLDTAAKDAAGLTPLDWAARNSHADVQEYLSTFPH